MSGVSNSAVNQVKNCRFFSAEPGFAFMKEKKWPDVLRPAFRLNGHDCVRAFKKLYFA